MQRVTRDLSREAATDPLVAVVLASVLEPYEIKVSDRVAKKSLRELTDETGLGWKLGHDLADALDESERVLEGSNGVWLRFALSGVGAASLVLTGGLAIAAAPVGVSGVAAIVAGLAAFGPGRMLGGLLTAGALVSEVVVESRRLWPVSLPAPRKSRRSSPRS